MNEKFNKNAKVGKFTTMLGIAVRLIVIDPYIIFMVLSFFHFSIGVEKRQFLSSDVENIGLVCFGHDTSVLSHPTKEFSSLKHHLSKLNLFSYF